MCLSLNPQSPSLGQEGGLSKWLFSRGLNQGHRVPDVLTRRELPPRADSARSPSESSASVIPDSSHFSTVTSQQPSARELTQGISHCSPFKEAGRANRPQAANMAWFWHLARRFSLGFSFGHLNKWHKEQRAKDGQLSTLKAWELTQKQSKLPKQKAKSWG